MKNISSQLFSTPTLTEHDILAVLVTGKPFAQIGQQDKNALLGTIAGLGLRRHKGLATQLRDKLGLDTLTVSDSGNISNSMLTIGKFLTPRIFVRYGVGLFDNQSTVAIDYSISNKVKLQAESGEYQSVDVTYTIEK